MGMHSDPDPLRPGGAMRSAGIALVCLVGVAVLAAMVVRQRRRIELGARVRPPGWNLSYRVPRHWPSGTVAQEAAVHTRIFYGQGRRGPGSVRLVVTYFRTAEATTPAEVCLSAAMVENPESFAQTRPLALPSSSDLRRAKLVAPQAGLAIHAAVHDDRQVLLMQAVGGIPLERSVIDLVEAVAASVLVSDAAVLPTLEGV